MPEGNYPHTQLICESEPACLCVPEGSDNTWNECDCFDQEQGQLFPQCAGCGAPLVEINFETGERIAA